MSGWSRLLVRGRAAAGLRQEEMARLAGTSRPTLSAYEHGRKVPGADTLERLLAVAGLRIGADPVVSWRQEPAGGGRTCWVPDRLWRLGLAEALGEAVPPVEVNWSAPDRVYRLRDRRERHRLYEVLLREGEPGDLERWVDGVLLLDAWDELVLPRRIRALWQPVIDSALDVDGLRVAS